MSPAAKKTVAAPAAPTTDAKHQRLTKFIRGLFDDTTVQALICASLSFSHIHQLADEQGQTGFRSWAYPLSVDLLLAAAFKKVRTSIRVKKGRTNVVFWFLVALAASIAANVATAPKTPLGISVAVWPVVGLVGCTALSGGARDSEADPDAEREPSVGGGQKPPAPAPVPTQRAAGNRSVVPAGTGVPVLGSRPEPLALGSGNRSPEPAASVGNRALEPAPANQEPSPEPANAGAEPEPSPVDGTDEQSARRPGATPRDIRIAIRELAKGLPDGEKPKSPAVITHLNVAMGLGARKAAVLQELNAFTSVPASSTPSSN